MVANIVKKKRRLVVRSSKSSKIKSGIKGLLLKSKDVIQSVGKSARQRAPVSDDRNFRIIKREEKKMPVGKSYTKAKRRLSMMEAKKKMKRKVALAKAKVKMLKEKKKFNNKITKIRRESDF